MELFKSKSSEYFDCYFDFIEKKSACSVNNLLSAAKRVNELLIKDTLNINKKNLLGSKDFLLIKMLRNFNEHEGDVFSDFKMLDKLATEELKPDLGFCCLISTQTYKAAKHGREVNVNDIKKIDSAASIIGDYIDIHPAIFNLSVYIYECLTRFGLSIDTKEFLWFKESYDKETLHDIDHYIVPLNHSNIILSSGKSIEKHIVPFNALSKTASGLPDYNLMVCLDKPLDINSIEFDDIAKNLKEYIKCVDGKEISYYERDLIQFEKLHSSNVLLPLKTLLSYSSQKFEATVVNVGSFVESHKEEEVRIKLLNYNISAIFTFGKEKYMTRYDYTFELLLYLSMLVNIKIHGLEHKETKAMFKIINSNNSSEAVKALSRISNKAAIHKLSHLIFSQMVMTLIEFPFKDHQQNSK
ncbi:hypothetical protein A9Q74_14840 [Colwellia sp. 39_35_sub15_T18]|nr:hypothetical protein A9Q74_14840 [Colwellia sp. 39_35_sub15_T18]